MLPIRSSQDVGVLAVLVIHPSFRPSPQLGPLILGKQMYGIIRSLRARYHDETKTKNEKDFRLVPSGYAHVTVDIIQM